MKSGPIIRHTHGPHRALVGLLLLLVAMFGVALVVILVELGASKLLGESQQLGPSDGFLANSEVSVFSGFLGALAMFGVMWVLFKTTIGGPGILFGLRQARRWWLALFVVSAGSLSEVFYTWAQLLMPGWETGSIEGIRDNVQAGGISSAFSLISILVLAPVLEEVVFRGWLYSGLVHRARPTRTILLTTLAFVAFHMDPHHSFATIPLGLFLGWLRAVTGSIWPCILAHVINNLVATLGFMAVDLGFNLPIELFYLGLLPLAVIVWKLRFDLDEPRVLLDQHRWSPEVHARLQELLDGPPGLACFDWDNTCIEGDIGDALLMALDGPGGALWAAHEAQIAAGDVAEAYRDAACVLAGRTLGESRELCEDVFREGVAKGAITPVAEMADLMTALRAAGWDVWVVSASAEPMACAAAATYGVPAERVIGMRPAVSNGRILGEIEGPVLYGPGKVEAIGLRIGRLPDLALGDALTDREMMLSAGHALLIGTRAQEMVELAAEQGWRIQPRFSGVTL